MTENINFLRHCINSFSRFSRFLVLHLLLPNKVKNKFSNYTNISGNIFQKNCIFSFSLPLYLDTKLFAFAKYLPFPSAVLQNQVSLRTFSLSEREFQT